MMLDYLRVINALALLVMVIILHRSLLKESRRLKESSKRLQGLADELEACRRKYFVDK